MIATAFGKREEGVMRFVAASSMSDGEVTISVVVGCDGKREKKAWSTLTHDDARTFAECLLAIAAQAKRTEDAKKS